MSHRRALDRRQFPEVSIVQVCLVVKPRSKCPSECATKRQRHTFIIRIDRAPQIRIPRIRRRPCETFTLGGSLLDDLPSCRSKISTDAATPSPRCRSRVSPR